MFMKHIAPTLLFSLLALSACSGSPADIPSDMPPPEGEMDENVFPTSEETSSATSSVDMTDDAEADVRIIEMTVDDWMFTPAAISAAKDEKVIVRLTGVAGIHSFAVAELGINVRVEPGQTVDVEIPTGTAGTFAFRCRVPCGPGHQDMAGSLVIS